MGGARAETSVTEKIFEWLALNINPLITYGAKEVVGWQERTRKFADFLDRHHMRAAIVTAEANIHLYRDEIYEFIHEWINLTSQNPNLDKPHLDIVAGPILHVSSHTGRSVVVELWRERIADIYFSPHRQAQHYMIGDWNEKGEIGRKGINEVIIEEPCSPMMPSYRRKQTYVSTDAERKLVLECRDSFRKLTREGRSNPLVPVKEESDLERFIFMTSGEIRDMTSEAKKDFGKKAFSAENEENLRWHYFTVAMKALGIDQRKYPGPCQPKGQ